MSLRSYLKARKTALNPAKITLRNIYAVFQAWLRKKRRGLGGFDLPNHMYEQIIWRRVQAKGCMNNETCIQCGCEMLGKTMEDRGCEGGCYPDMMNSENWEVYKRINNIKLFK